jgi:hypothetical protein
VQSNKQLDTRTQRKPALSILVFIVAVLSPALGSPLAGPRTAQSSPVPEYQVKATFLYQFTQFVDWPSEAFPPGQTSFVIGVLGPDPFGKFLDEVVRGEKASNRPLAVQRYRRLEDVANCHVLYVSESEAARTEDIVAAVKGQGILVVGDADGFADRGGMVQFVSQGNRIRLRINLEAAKAARLTISSKILRPATVVSPGAP